MTWVLYIWIGYAGSHSTMTYHAEFQTEHRCIEVGKSIKQIKVFGSRAVADFLCIQKDTK